MQSSKNNVYTLDDDDVITDIPVEFRLGTGITFTTQQLVERFGSPLGCTPDRPNYSWISEGVSGKVLSANGNTSGWQQGKIRVRFEFIPDITENSEISVQKLDRTKESDLDQIRNSIEPSQPNLNYIG